jgi:hypothetical protein
MLFAVLIVVGVDIAAAEERDRAETQQSKTATREPIPDDNAPQELKRLIEDGKVKVVYDSDPKFVKEARGWADFQVDLRYTFKYNLTKTRKNGHWRVRLAITKLEPKIELTHLVRLPVTFKSPRVWQSGLLRHEFDHVAICLDPRARLLLRHLLKKLRIIDRTLESDEEPTDERLNKLIDDEITKRREAVVELMRQNNVLLDKVSAHGARLVPDRAAFFEKLYSKEHLAEQKFPFVDQVLDLLDKPEYRDAERPFLRRDPNDP